MILFIRAAFVAIAMLVTGAVLTANITTFAQFGLDDSAHAAKKSDNSQKKCKSSNCNP